MAQDPKAAYAAGRDRLVEAADHLVKARAALRAARCPVAAELTHVALVNTKKEIRHRDRMLIADRVPDALPATVRRLYAQDWFRQLLAKIKAEGEDKR